jgi:hypothetical protein
MNDPSLPPTDSSKEPDSIQSRQANWATPVSRLKLSGAPAGAVNLNVDGRQLTGPLKGFGQLWQKTYKVRLSGVKVTPAEVIRVWKADFPSFWPGGNHFYASLTGIRPGEVALLNLAGPGGVTAPGGLPVISTGVMVIYSDEVSFSFMTPQGHMFAAMITFSADEDDSVTMAQVQALVRASDPIYELTFRLGFGHRTEDAFWRQTLENLSRRFGVQGQVQQEVTCVDARVQWSEARNIWHNAAIRTALYTPVAMLRRAFQRSKRYEE